MTNAKKAHLIIHAYSTRENRIAEVAKIFGMKEKDVQTITQLHDFKYGKKVTQINANPDQRIHPIHFDYQYEVLDSYPDDIFIKYANENGITVND